MIITTEEPRHSAAIEALLDQSFGTDRHTKTAYRLRDTVAPLSDLGLVALEHDDHGEEVLQGTIRYWPISIGGFVPALLLGPIAVAPHLQGAGLGSKLIRMSLNKAAAAGHRIVLLVGDAPYYSRFGFTRRLTMDLQLPGPVDLDRFLGLEIVPGALDGVSGMINPWTGTATEDLAIPVPGAFATPAGFAQTRLWYARPA